MFYLFSQFYFLMMSCWCLEKINVGPLLGLYGLRDFNNLPSPNWRLSLPAQVCKKSTSVDLCTYQCKSRGGGVRARGGDLMPETIPYVGLLIVRSAPGVGTFDFDRQNPGINSEAVTKYVPRDFLTVTLLEKGMKFSFVLIAIIRYFKLSSKQIMSILRKFLSSSSHLIVKLDWNWIPPWKSEDFL